MTLPRVALISNIPSPYREGAHIELNNKLGINYHVYYCAHTEENRLWKINYGQYNKTFLKKSTLKIKNKAIYINFDIIRHLNKFNPSVVITAGFFPTMLLAFFWCKFKGKKHLVYTDGTPKSEEHLTKPHRFIRKFVYRFTDAYIGVSKKSLDLYRNYKIKEEKLFLSPYCADNALLSQFRNTSKKYDIVFCGQFIERKMPFFFLDVIRQVNTKRKFNVLLIGSGELKESLIEAFDKYEIDYYYPGFVQPDSLPLLFSSAKVLLFPTKFDAWGLVANEACAFGIPVITCENAGAANELIVNNYNGFVLPLDEDIWADHLFKLLTDESIYHKFSENAFLSVQKYNYRNAVDGLIEAIQYAQKN